MPRSTARPSGSQVAALLLAVACVAFAAVVLTRGPASTAPFVAPGGLSPAQVGVPSSPPSALFIGDSYTGGYGARLPQQGYACLTAVAMGWTCSLDAQGGTGYVSDGHLDSTANRPVPDRLADDRKQYRADVVIVDAGRNDLTFGVDRTAGAADRFLGAVREAYPEAKLVVIVPAYMNSTAGTFPFSRELAPRLRASAERHDAIVLDPLAQRWSGADPAADLVIEDGVHPSPKGHQLWAKRLTAALKKAGLGDLSAATSSP